MFTVCSFDLLNHRRTGLIKANIFIQFSSLFLLFFQDSFQSFGRSLVKTGVMMIGEFEFDSLYDSSVPPLSWALFIIFLVVMTLILMNLLVSTVRMRQTIVNIVPRACVTLSQHLRPPLLLSTRNACSRD